MALTMRWVGYDQRDRVAETRWMCYAAAGRDIARYRENLIDNAWARDGDFLLAERDGAPVGTATSLSLTMWVRGAPLSCQGVAYVGTIKTARRRGGDESGIASAVMTETLRIARQRNHVISALMPFRVSFYEHFGYGMVERRTEWTIPLSIMPAGNCDGWRFLRPEDRAPQAAQWQRAVQAGQCDVERSDKRWQELVKAEEDGMVFVDRPDPTGPVRASAFITPELVEGRTLLKVQAWSADSLADFTGLLCFLGTLRDQHPTAAITVPAAWQINRLLREGQLPHRPVAHATAETRSYARMQLRILDHRRFLQALTLPPAVTGRVGLAIHESEGGISRFTVDLADTRAAVSDGAARTDLECTDVNWAAIATGDLPATQAVRLGLATENTPGAAATLDALAAGPAPFCREYF